MTEVDAERARKMAREAVERYPHGGLHTVARWALELDARVRQLESSIKQMEGASKIAQVAGLTPSHVQAVALETVSKELQAATARAERAERQRDAARIKAEDLSEELAFATGEARQSCSWEKDVARRAGGGR